MVTARGAVGRAPRGRPPAASSGARSVPVPPSAGPPDQAARLRFLRSPAAYRSIARVPGSVTVVETHMAWVFLAGERVWKLKKPVRFPYLDFTSLEAREHACREELRLNARLAPGVVLGLDALRWDGRRLSLVPETAPASGARTLDWLVRMRRLPSERMLDRLAAGHAVSGADVDALADLLVAFYRRAERPPPDPEGFVERFRREHRTNRLTLADPRFGFAEAGPVLERFEHALERAAPRLRERCLLGRVVDGHGDLRPEHVCLLRPPRVIDALEFDARLRQVDPFEEVALLWVECDLAGAGWVGARLARALAGALADPQGVALLPLYRAYRALLRARLAVAHLFEPEPRRAAHWLPLARRFVALVLRECPALEFGND